MNAILHVDVDAFYASVEELDRPELKAHPIAVAGRSESSIITTANYKARAYGVHSAMPVFMAKKLCPDLVLVPGRRQRYLELSRQIFAIFEEYTELVEKISIDEAFLDLSSYSNPLKVGKEIQRRIYRETGLTVSCGLSYNKFLAKLASDWKKPRGFTVIVPEQIPDILKPLSIKKVHGIGQKSAEKLNQLGIETIEDLLELDLEFMERLMGKQGLEIYERIRGKDKRKVKPHRVRKRISTETTFEVHTLDRKFLDEKLMEFSRELVRLMEAKKITGYTLTVKIRTIDFQIHTKSRTYPFTLSRWEQIYELALELLDELNPQMKLRLMGLGISNLVSENREQLYFL